MRGHPAVEMAAVALLRGFDPMAFAALAGVEQAFATQVLNRAARLHADEMGAFAQAIGAHVGNRVGEIMARALSS